MNDYALYKGDEFMDLGTIKYLSKKYHIAEKTLRYYGMPTGIKRAGKNGYILIKIEENTNEWFRWDRNGLHKIS